MPLRDNPKQSIRPGAQIASTWEEWVAMGKEIAGIEEKLLQLLENERDPVTRSWAAQALGFVGGELCVKALINALEFDIPLVQMEAAYALGLLGQPEAVEPLCRALSNTDSNVRANASMALGRLRSAKALACLKEALQDKDTFVQAAAREALREDK
jgi:HEAT repeat protein